MHVNALDCSVLLIAYLRMHAHYTCAGGLRVTVKEKKEKSSTVTRIESCDACAPRLES